MTRAIPAALALILPLILPGPSPAVAGDLLAGASAVVITPEPGTPMAGYYFERAAEEVHDDLFAKAIVLQSGDAEGEGERIALVALDLISTTRDLVADAREAIEEATGIPGPNVMISATHAHTGPVIADRSRRSASLGGGSDLSRGFRDGLPAKIAEAVLEADSKKAPARILTASGSESSIAFNRRFHMADGSVGWNPGKGNPNILKPAGPIDPEVPVVYVESLDGDPIAVYVNYAVHLDNVGGPAISADLPYTLSKCLAAFKGPDLVTLFTAGCCGDINHINVNWSEPQKGHDNAARMGVILAAEVLRLWPELEEVEVASIRVARETVELPLPEVGPDDEAKAEEVAGRHRSGSAPQPSFLETVHAYKVLDVAGREGEPWEIEVQAVSIGDRIAWVSLPGEIFVELGLEIKQDSPFKRTIIAELANGSIGYIPSRRAYGQGNYEVVSARCAEGSGEMLVHAAVRLLKGLHGDAREDD
jgi:neutral ceramidase